MLKAQIKAPFISFIPKLNEIEDNENDKLTVRSSLKASTIDGVFAAFFTYVTTEALLSNFLLKLGATGAQMGFVYGIPMFANFLQPLGAYLGDRTTSRRWYNVLVFSPARLIWIILLLGIIGFELGWIKAHQLVLCTLVIVTITHLCNALGNASWLSWMNVLVPGRLRGRYFGVRNSAASFIGLLCGPLLGQIVSRSEEMEQGYGFVLTLAILAGLISLCAQFFMDDVNPQSYKTDTEQESFLAMTKVFQDNNFVKFLLYRGLWMFAINLSLPFFNYYFLKNLNIDICWLTFYGSLSAAGNVVMLIFWGKLADRIGNRPILLIGGLGFTTIPLLWLLVGNEPIFLYLWFPLLYIFTGGILSAVELCHNNLQMALVPKNLSSSYFGLNAAIGGLCGALATVGGGFLLERVLLGDTVQLFPLSSMLAIVALFPLIFVHESGKSNFSLFENISTYLVGKWRG